MNYYEIVKEQIEGANEHLAQLKAPYRLSYTKQDSRMQINSRSLAQIENNGGGNSLLLPTTMQEANKFMLGFNAALAMLSIYSAPNITPAKIEKLFSWKDLTGRGYKGKGITLETVLKSADEDTRNWNGDLLSEWAEEAEEGDEWENATEKYTCTQS